MIPARQALKDLLASREPQAPTVSRGLLVLVGIRVRLARRALRESPVQQARPARPAPKAPQAPRGLRVSRESQVRVVIPARQAHKVPLVSPALPVRRALLDLRDLLASPVQPARQALVVTPVRRERMVLPE